MFKDKNKAVFFLISLLFIALNLVFIAYDFYYIAFLPVLILFLFTAIVSIDKIFLLVVFFTPLSVRLDEFIHIYHTKLNKIVICTAAKQQLCHFSISGYLKYDAVKNLWLNMS